MNASELIRTIIGIGIPIIGFTALIYVVLLLVIKLIRIVIKNIRKFGKPHLISQEDASDSKETIDLPKMNIVAEKYKTTRDLRAELIEKNTMIENQDRCLMNAASKVGVPYMGCDTLDMLTETILELKKLKKNLIKNAAYQAEENDEKLRKKENEYQKICVVARGRSAYGKRLREKLRRANYQLGVYKHDFELSKKSGNSAKEIATALLGIVNVVIREGLTDNWNVGNAVARLTHEFPNVEQYLDHPPEFQEK